MATYKPELVAYLVVGGHKVVIAVGDGHVAVGASRILAPLAHIACRVQSDLSAPEHDGRTTVLGLLSNAMMAQAGVRLQAVHEALPKGQLADARLWDTNSSSQSDMSGEAMARHGVVLKKVSTASERTQFCHLAAQKLAHRCQWCCP